MPFETRTLTIRFRPIANSGPKARSSAANPVRRIWRVEEDMKKISVCFIMGVLLLAAFNVFGQEQAEAPKYKNGDFWHFRGAEREGFAHTTAALQGDYKVLYLGGKLKVFKLEAGKEFELSEGNGQEFEFSEGDKTYQVAVLKRMLGLKGSLQYLQFPLFVDKKWKSSWQSRLRGSTKVHHDEADSNVTAIENVSTPAGSFRAFKIERQQRFGTTIAWLTYYYSPLTKSIVKYSYYEESRQGKICCKREIELIKFGSAR